MNRFHFHNLEDIDCCNVDFAMNCPCPGSEPHGVCIRKWVQILIEVTQYCAAILSDPKLGAWSPRASVSLK